MQIFCRLHTHSRSVTLEIDPDIDRVSLMMAQLDNMLDNGIGRDAQCIWIRHTYTDEQGHARSICFHGNDTRTLRELHIVRREMDVHFNQTQQDVYTDFRNVNVHMPHGSVIRVRLAASDPVCYFRKIVTHVAFQWRCFLRLPRGYIPTHRQFTNRIDAEQDLTLCSFQLQQNSRAAKDAIISDESLTLSELGVEDECHLNVIITKPYWLRNNK